MNVVITNTYLDHSIADLITRTKGLDDIYDTIQLIPITPELEADALTRYTALAGYVDEVESLLKNVTYGLSALQVLISATALASVCTEARLSELGAANMPADLDVVKADTPYIHDLAISIPTTNSIADFVNRLARGHILKSSTATSDGAVNGTTLIDSTLTEADDFWNGCMVVNTAVGQVREIVDFDAATDTVTVSPAFSAQIQTGTGYVIIPGISLYKAIVTDRLDNATYGLSAIETLVDDVEGLLTNGTYGLSALKTLIAAIPITPELEANALTRYNALAGYVDEIESLLMNVTYGLSALKTEIDANETKIDVIDGNVDIIVADTPYLADAALPVTPTAGSIGRLVKDYLDVAVSSRLASASYVTERGTDNAALASVCTEARLANLDALISSRLATASYVTERGTDNAELEADALTRYNALAGYVDSLETWLGNPSGGALATITAQVGQPTEASVDPTGNTGSVEARLKHMGGELDSIVTKMS